MLRSQRCVSVSFTMAVLWSDTAQESEESDSLNIKAVVGPQPYKAVHAGALLHFSRRIHAKCRLSDDAEALFYAVSSTS